MAWALFFVPIFAQGVTCPARKDLCIDGNYKLLHVTRLADVIPLRFAVRVRPMQGIFRALLYLLPAAAIPNESMTGAQLRLWHHTQEVMQGKEPWCSEMGSG